MVGTSCARGIPLGALAAWAGLAGGDSLHLVCERHRIADRGFVGRTVVVGVDDLHLLDDLSMFVLQQIVQRGVAKVVLTERDDEPIPLEYRNFGSSDSSSGSTGAVVAGDYTRLLSATLAGSLEPETAAACGI